MRQFRARTKMEKCQYKRCMYRKTLPVEKPKYCGKHGEKLLALAAPRVKEENGIIQRIKSFIYASTN